MEDQVVIVVTDTGIGIAADRQDAIFGEFVQENDLTARRHGGTGLGLTISSELAKLMHGTLVLASAPGVGTTVTLRVPLIAAPPAEAADTPPVEAPSAIPDVRVLVAEDHPVNQLLVRAMLARLGHQADFAVDGAEAVRMVSEAAAIGAPYALVLMDMHMPVLDGLEATRTLRDAGMAPEQLPVVALTANAYATDIAACLDAGMQAHLEKPLNIARLDAALRRWAVLPGAAPKPAAAILDTARIADLRATIGLADADRLLALMGRWTSQHVRWRSSMRLAMAI